MKFQDFNTSLTFKLYTIAGLLFGIYGGVSAQCWKRSH